MIRVVLDTNIIVSALLNDEGNEAAVLLLALQRTLRLYISPSILTEYNDVLHRLEFGRFGEEILEQEAAGRCTTSQEVFL
ncbi:MAG: putative toxin-antitoxin system toxin component, PIN family [Blastocatellia bacterium AA13]|nr:MAG: putative toxin-antitoxin system toxin component, PIN family [Blastocatellia bacterium AA13]